MSGVIDVEWLEDSSAVIMARVEGRPLAPGARGAALVAADFSAINYSVVDVTTPGNEQVVSGHSDVALAPATVISAGLEPWHVDTVGHNFRARIAETAFPIGDHEYQVEVKWTHADGLVGHTRWRGKAQPVFRS